MAERIPDGDGEINLTPEGWGDWLGYRADRDAEEEERQQRTEDLLEAARQALASADWPCCCRRDYQCQRCRVQAMLYPAPVHEWQEEEVPW